MLWVILFFYFGVLSLKGFRPLGPTGTLEFCGLRCLRPDRVHAQAIWISRLVGIRPYNAIAFQVLLPYLLVYSSSILSDNLVGSLRRPLVCRQFSDSTFSTRIS